MTFPEIPTQNESARLFLAIFPPREVADRIAGLLVRLQTGARFADAHPAWVLAANVHVTLEFLGEQPQEVIGRLIDELEVMTRSGDVIQPFSLATEKFLYLPSPAAPSVLGLTIGKETHKLQVLQGTIRELCMRLGIKVETRPYKAHLTLARIKSRKAGDRIKGVVEGNQKFASFEWPVRSFGLYQSVLGLDGPSYTLLREFAMHDHHASE